MAIHAPGRVGRIRCLPLGQQYMKVIAEVLVVEYRAMAFQTVSVTDRIVLDSRLRIVPPGV